MRARHGKHLPPPRALCAAVVILIPCTLTSTPGHALDLDLMSVSARARVGEKRVLGKVAPESFREYDVAATLRLPWQYYTQSGWGVGLRLMASGGILQGANKTALVVSAIPLLAIGSEDGRFTADIGAGLALISEHRFAQQDFGGPLQGALTLGVTVPLYRRVGVGYRFMHYSDWGAYGPSSIGVDFHMVEFSYRF
jgi:hypothetical protein